MESLNSRLGSNKEEDGKITRLTVSGGWSIVGFAATSGIQVRVVLFGTVLDLRTTTSQECEAVPRRARIQGA